MTWKKNVKRQRHDLNYWSSEEKRWLGGFDRRLYYPFSTLFRLEDVRLLKYFVSNGSTMGPSPPPKKNMSNG